MSKLTEHQSYFIEPIHRPINYVHTEENFLSKNEIEGILNLIKKENLKFGKVGQSQNNNNTSNNNNFWNK